MKRTRDTLNNEKAVDEAEKKNCKEAHWFPIDLNNSSVIYRCIIHRNDKYICSIYECKGIKTSKTPNLGCTHHYNI